MKPFANFLTDVLATNCYPFLMAIHIRQLPQGIGLCLTKVLLKIREKESQEDQEDNNV